MNAYRRRALCLAAALSLAVTAAAEIQLFFTSSADPWRLAPAGHPNYGIAADPFAPSAGNGVDYYDGYILKNSQTQDAIFPIPDGTTALPDVAVDLTQGEFAYLWLHFTAAESWADKISGIEELGFSNAAESAMYQCDNGGGRWEGCAAPLYPELKQNPVNLVSVTSYGISMNIYNKPSELYVGSGRPPNYAYRTALLGAVRPADFGFVEGSAISAWTYPTGERPFRFLNKVAAVPEPGGAVMVALAALLLRRR